MSLPKSIRGDSDEQDVVAKYDATCAERIRGLTVQQAIEHDRMATEIAR
jgi:hypothetical protein